MMQAPKVLDEAGNKRKRKENTLLSDKPMQYVNGWKVPVPEIPTAQATTSSGVPSNPPLARALPPLRPPINLPAPDGTVVSVEGSTTQKKKKRVEGIAMKEKKQETLWDANKEAFFIDTILKNDAHEFGHMGKRFD